MGFLDRLRGVPESIGAPPAAPTMTPRSSAADGGMRAGRQFDLGGLPFPNHDVHTAVEAGELIGAIKAYREQSGAGLAESKRVVDALARGDKVIARTVEYDVADPAYAAQVAADAQTQIDAFIAAGQKIAAIKVYRELHGTGLAESKNAVEARAAELKRGV